jgi:hypothetical protein
MAGIKVNGSEFVPFRYQFGAGAVAGISEVCIRWGYVGIG